MEIIKITEKALNRIKKLVEQNDNKDSFKGVRLSVKERGCSGQAYHIEYAYEIAQYDEVIDCKNFKIIIDGKSLMFFIGSEMDFITNNLSSGFVFNNPNSKGQCGCGESFHF